MVKLERVLPGNLHAHDQIEGWVRHGSGIIVHSANGGRTWELQASRVSGDIQAVHFVDANVGWAVGKLNGVILHTTNAGSTWNLQFVIGPDVADMSINDVYFKNATRGWAVGTNGESDQTGRAACNQSLNLEGPVKLVCAVFEISSKV